MATAGDTLLRLRLLLAAIASTKRPSGARFEMEERLKLSLKRVKDLKMLTYTLLPFVLRRNISKDKRQ